MLTNIYVRCICCTDPMTGIMDTAVRDVCEPCGGHAKVQVEWDSDAGQFVWRARNRKQASA